MADPKVYIPDFDDHIQTLDEMLRPGGSLGIDYEPVDDQRSEENVVNQRNVGKNIMLDEDINQFEHGTSEAGPSRVYDQSGEAGPSRVDEHIRRNSNPQTSDFGNPIQIPQWPVPAQPYACSCCQVLREIIHTIEGESRKFEIHGRLGMISHGILEICRGDMNAPNKEYHMFDFCKESTHRVKMFLEQYCKKQKEAGYTMAKDPLLTFYQAVSVALDWDLNFDINDFVQGSQIHKGDMRQPNVTQPQARSNKVRSNKRTYKEQKDRAKTLTINDFTQYFHLPQAAAAKEVGVSVPICKDICREGGLKRWPHRQIKSLQKKIVERRNSLITANPEERARAEVDIQKFTQEIGGFYPPYRLD